MHIIVILDYASLAATIVLALTGVLQAARKGIDLFGALVLAFVCALGGGTIRDLLIDSTPVFWVEDTRYVMVIIPTVLIAAWFIRKIPENRGIRLRYLEILDAMGLALFCILGTDKALQLGISPLIAVGMGVVTGVAGGMIRDVLTGEQPYVFNSELYATAAIVGCSAYVIIKQVRDNHLVSLLAMLIAMILVFILRLLALRGRWRLPTIYHANSADKDKDDK